MYVASIMCGFKGHQCNYPTCIYIYMKVNEANIDYIAELKKNIMKIYISPTLCK